MKCTGRREYKVKERTAVVLGVEVASLHYRSELYV